MLFKNMEEIAKKIMLVLGGSYILKNEDTPIEERIYLWFVLNKNYDKNSDKIQNATIEINNLEIPEIIYIQRYEIEEFDCIMVYVFNKRVVEYKQDKFKKFMWENSDMIDRLYNISDGKITKEFIGRSILNESNIYLD